MRIITLEEHFATPGFLDGPGQDLKNAALKFEGRATRLIEQLTDIADKRIAAMDSAGIDMQVLSLTSPGTEQLDAGDAVALSREVNDFLAAGVKKNPKRFAGFATLPTAAPDKAAAELESRMKSGGFVGAVSTATIAAAISTTSSSGRSWKPPRRSTRRSISIRRGRRSRWSTPIIRGFSPLLDDMFASPGWGWHIETAVHVIRIMLGGTFDRFPKLQLVIGHLGEGLLSMFQRLDVMTPAMTKLKRPVTSYLRENVHYRSRALTTRRPSSISCWKSASTASCSRPIIPISRWRRPRLSASKSRSPPPTASASRTAMPRSFSGCSPDGAQRNPGWQCGRFAEPRIALCSIRATHLTNN